MEDTTHNIVRDGKVHVCEQMCSTCIFRPGNLMHLEPGRVTGMVKEAVEGESTIVCHQTLDTDANAACRGFVDRYTKDVATLQIAFRLNLVEEVNP